MTIAVQFIDVSRIFGDVRAVDRVSVEIQDGEFSPCLGLLARVKPPACG